MAWAFADSFDLYSPNSVYGADMAPGYWDVAMNSIPSFAAGRFSVGQSMIIPNANNISPMTKSSAVNDQVHHISIAYNCAASAMGGTSLNPYITLYDGATAQCTIAFRSDGAILLYAGGVAAGAIAGAVLATFANGFSAINTWYQFEFEVVIHNTLGAFNVRVNSATSNNFSSGAINTRGGTANNYANKIGIGSLNGISHQCYLDDFFWKSDATFLPWMGDVRCYPRLPISDAAAQFSRSPSPFVAQTINSVLGYNQTSQAGTAIYQPFTPTITGQIPYITIFTNAAYATAKVKMAVYDSTLTFPIAVSNELVGVANGASTITFPSPAPIVKGALYYLAVCCDTPVNWGWNNPANARYNNSTSVYATFPLNNPVTSSGWSSTYMKVGIVPSINAEYVGEPTEDYLASYLYDANVNDADWYNIAPLGTTPTSIIAVVTRGFMRRSDAGARSAAIRLNSGGNIYPCSTLSLSQTVWTWSYRMDLTNPATGLPWQPSEVDAVQIGPLVVA